MKEKVKKLIDDADFVVIATDKGVGVQGRKGDCFFGLGLLLHHFMNEVGVEKETIKNLVDTASEKDFLEEKGSEYNDKIDKQLEDIKKIVKEMRKKGNSDKNVEELLKTLEKVNKLMKET